MQPDDPHPGVAVLSYSGHRVARRVWLQVGRWILIAAPLPVAACFVASRLLAQQATRIYHCCTSLMESPQFFTQQQIVLDWSRTMQRFQFISSMLGLGGAVLCMLWLCAAACLLYFYIGRRKLAA